MFQNKILMNFAKLYKNCFKNKTEIYFFCVNSMPFKHLISQNIFSYNKIQNNGRHKSFITYKNEKFGENKKNFSKLFDDICWNCNQGLKLKKFACASCGALQYPKESINYFELFGISQSYEIDIEELSTKFKNFQKAFHPDKFVNKPKIEKEISEEYSRLANKAYATLKDSLSRGFYILKCQKIPDDSTFSLEQEFLLSIMEKNEELENIDNKNILNKFWKTNSDEIEKQIRKISDAFHHSKWNDAKINLLKLKYYVNLETKIKEKQNNFTLSKET